MTGLLRDTMSERADNAGYPQLDLQAIIEAGDRRVAPPRVAMTGGAAVVALPSLPRSRWVRGRSTSTATAVTQSASRRDRSRRTARRTRSARRSTTARTLCS